MRTKKRNINKKIINSLIIYNNLSKNGKKIFGGDILNSIKRYCKKKKVSYNKLRKSIWKKRRKSVRR